MNKLNKLVSGALVAAATYGAAITGIREVVKATLGRKMDDKGVRAELIGPVAAHYGITLESGERGVRFDSDNKSYEAAKKALQRLTKDVMGTAKNHDTYEVPADMLAVATKLIQLANGYESADGKSIASKLIASAIAQAKAA